MNSVLSNCLYASGPKRREADPWWVAGDRAQRVVGRHG